MPKTTFGHGGFTALVRFHRNIVYVYGPDLQDFVLRQQPMHSSDPALIKRYL